jgi:hypothetical protein
MPVEKIVDGMIRLLSKNVVARTPLIADLNTGGGIVFVDNTFHFEDGNELAIVDSDGVIEFHVLLQVIDTNRLQLLQPVQRDFLLSKGAIVQKAIAGLPLYENNILFGDREVIPNNEVAVTVEPVTLTNDWIYLQGGLDEEYRLSIMIYLRDDQFEDALRSVLKYSDNIYRLLNQSVHMPVVNDEIDIIANLSAGDTIIPIVSTNGWPVDGLARYEVQDNNHVEIDFRIEEVVSPTEVRINRPLVYNYLMSDKLKFRRRVLYIYDSRVNNVEFGTISKNNTLYKAAKLSWFGKETEEYPFPQPSKAQS